MLIFFMEGFFLRKSVSFLLACFLVLSLFSPVAAQSGQSQSEFEIQSINGVVKNHEFKDVDSSANLQNIQLSQTDGSAQIQGKLTYKGRTYDLSLTGNLYPATGKGAYDKKLVLGEFKGTKDFNVLQLWVEKQNKGTVLLKENRSLEGKTILSLILEHKKSGERVILQKALPDQEFTQLFSGAQQQVKNHRMKANEVREKIVNLMYISRKSDFSKIEDSMDFKMTGKVDSKGKLSVEKPISIQADGWTDINVSQKELLRLLNDLKDSRRYPNGVQLSNYDIPESLFKGSGWKRYHYINSEPYGAYNARSEDYFYSTITQFSYLNLIARFNDALQGFESQTEINHGLALEYNHLTGQLQVVYYDTGLILEDLQIAHGALEGDNVYINQQVNGVLWEDPDLVAFVWGLIPYADTGYDIWDSLSGQELLAFGQVHSFQATPEDQRLVNNGKVYRTISSDFTGYTMRYEKHWGGVRGQIYGYPNIDSVTWSFQYTASIN